MNRLAHETSPYLRQHAANPVDWFPWGEEALQLATERDVPILISIGYAACHWCHVMAHESFEDEATAAAMNEWFVSIKIDREERPDLDAIYMESVQAMTGQGGWPLTVFATPNGRPFYGGTYFPRRAMHGLPGFSELLGAVASAWRDRRGELLEQADELTEAIDKRLSSPPASGATAVDLSSLVKAGVDRFGALFDSEYGGIGTAPKFPHPPMLELLCRASHLGDESARAMLDITLAEMASGGIYDQLGGGFHRYSVDSSWRVPHFEKMLYDQASLARIYLHHFELTGDARSRQVVVETLDFVIRELRSENGGFFSSLDADSDGDEGLYYTWSEAELVGALDPALLPLAHSSFAVGNDLGGRSVLARSPRREILRSSEEDAVREALLSARGSRIRPALDDKVITEWNAAVISTLAEAAMATGEARFADAALAAASFIETALCGADRRWLRSFTDGRAKTLALCGDYAWLVDAYTRLYELTGVARYLALAEEVAGGLTDLFSADDGGWFMNGNDAETLIVRPREIYDGVVAASGSVATHALARLGAITGNDSYRERAQRCIEAMSDAMASAPLGFPHLVSAVALARGESTEIVITGDRRDLVATAQRSYLPDAVLAWGEPLDNPLWEGRVGAQAYVCQNRVCAAPTDSVQGLQKALRAAA